MLSRSIAPPVITDRQALEEFSESLSDLAPKIERDVARLRAVPDDRETVSSLFRAIHNIKGDAALCRIDLAVQVVHPVETVLTRLRNGEIVFSDQLAETILLAIDRLELAIESIRNGRSLDALRLNALINGFEQMADEAPAKVDSCACELIEAVTDFRPPSESSLRILSGTSSLMRKSPILASEDLLFFLSLANQFEARSPLFKGRTSRLLRLAFETNQERDKPIDPQQLEAAVYMHDIGMMFLPEAIWLKTGRMTPEEKQELCSHPALGAGLLARIHGWEEAAQMVAQHHEMPDGRGYPEGIKGDQICDGAKILAIVDAFEAVMLKHIDRGKNRSVLRAIAEINACDTQFAPEWIAPFNQVIRRVVES